MTLKPAGLDYCRSHHGIREEDEHTCDFLDADYHTCDTCKGSGRIAVTGQGRDGFHECGDCDEEGLTLCDLTPLLYEDGRPA